MKKTFDQIESEIRSELTNQPYWGNEEIEQFLTDIIGKKVTLYDTKYDDGCDFEDEYVMKACFSTDDNEYTIHIYFGDNRLLIDCVDVIHRPIITESQYGYIYLLVDEYTYDDEKQEVLIVPFLSKESAIEGLKERYEWYIKESYLSQFVDDNGNVDEDELDDAYDSWDITEDSVDIYICSKDTSLSLYIKKEAIRK